MYDICLFNWVAAPLDRPESVTDPIIIYRASKVWRGYLSEDFCVRGPILLATEPTIRW